MNHRENGSTLVECMVAAVVLAALATGFGASEKARDLAVRHAFEETMATRVLQSAIETQREAGTAPHAMRECTLETPNLSEARLDCTVQELEPGLHEATWSLTWRPTGSGNLRRRDLTTRFCVDDPELETWTELEEPR